MARAPQVPQTSVTAASGLIDALGAARVDADEVLRAAGLNRAALSDPEGFIPSAAFARLLEECARATKDDCFGLHFGERFNPKSLGALVYVVLNSPTFEASAHNMARYVYIHNQAVELYHTIEGDRVYLRHVFPEPGLESVRQHNECNVVIALNIMRLMAGSAWSPLEVEFMHEAPQDTSEHTRVFGCPVSFGCPTDAMAIERELFERQVPAADPGLVPILKRYLDPVLEAMPREDDFLSSARKALAECIRDGSCNLAVVAKHLTLSPRSLQRRLEEHGIDFNSMLNETRRRFAVEYLKNPSNTLTEVAFLLGYSEVSAFNRAFKRWTGTTPLQHRRKTQDSRI